MLEPIQGTCIGLNRTAVAGCLGVDPILVNVAVEDLQPGAGVRHRDLISGVSQLIEARNDDDIAAHALDPALHHQHSRYVFH